MAACKVESIQETGNCGMYEATLGIGDHHEAITIIGVDLTECLKRTVVVVEAFEREKLNVK